ncbi:MAG TPA: hypothetical protein PLH38_02865 [Clostridia bacterium]|nr:hypothetical protein [Clostridia bacterium]
MAKTTNYELEKPAVTDYYDIGVFNSNADIIDTQMKANATAITGKANTGHSHVASDITSGILDGARIPLDNTLTSTSTAKAATANVAKQLNDKTVSLENAATQRTTGGTAPNFTVADATVTEYSAGLRRTIVAHADSGEEPKLNFNGKGAKPVYQATGKAAKWKAGQHVMVEYDGTSFFIVSGGGGIELPDTIEAGDNLLLYSVYPVTMSGGAMWLDYPVCAITIKRFGTYRFKYRTYGCSWTDGARLTKNGDVIANSIITPVANAVLKVIDVYCEANDVIKLQGYKTAGIVDPIFLVSIAVPEISSAISTIITVP